jgi:hypothetical protein
MSGASDDEFGGDTAHEFNEDALYKDFLAKLGTSGDDAALGDEDSDEEEYVPPSDTRPEAGDASVMVSKKEVELLLAVWSSVCICCSGVVVLLLCLTACPVVRLRAGLVCTCSRHRCHDARAAVFVFHQGAVKCDACCSVIVRSVLSSFCGVRVMDSSRRCCWTLAAISHKAGPHHHVVHAAVVASHRVAVGACC